MPPSRGGRAGGRRPLIEALADLDPPVPDPEAAIAELRVTVDGAVVTNPRSLVRRDARLVVRQPRRPQGVRKLGHALDRLGVEVAGRLAVDLGACTGGFTLALLDRGARRVWAVDAGHGQLLGRLRQDERVVNAERTNLADVDLELLGEHPGIVVADVTKLPLREVGRQVAANQVPGPGTDLVGLVKPMFELARGDLPDAAEARASVDLAAEGLTAAGWCVVATMESEVRGHHGAVEYFVHATWP